MTKKTVELYNIAAYNYT